MNLLIKRIFALCAVFFFVTALSAQERPTRTRISQVPLKTRMELLREQRELGQFDLTPEILEGIIEEGTYVLGPGDELLVGIWGQLQEEVIPLMVLPEGIVFLQSVGDVAVSGLILKEAKMLIENRLTGIYPESIISVTLYNVRKFKVYITGAVELPKEYTANATTRVSSVIEQALGLNRWADGRSIEIRHKNGTVDYFDYWKYLSHGSQSISPGILTSP
ncbi:polysaccharide biosynthesis/export family protein [candidate division KSB1 bacterium]